MTAANPEEQAGAHATSIPERLAAIEANQNYLIGEMRENARRHDDNYKALDTKFDRLVFTIIGVGAGVIVTLIGGIVTLVIT